jgi:hypothetical protein
MPKFLSKETIHFIVSKNKANFEFIERFNASLKKIIASGIHDAIVMHSGARRPWNAPTACQATRVKRYPNTVMHEKVC